MGERLEPELSSIRFKVRKFLMTVVGVTVLASQNPKDITPTPVYRTLRKLVHVNLKRHHSVLIGAHEFPIWAEVGRVLEGGHFEPKAGLTPHWHAPKMWGVIFTYRFRSPEL
jgi:hypothetical protein